MARWRFRCPLAAISAAALTALPLVAQSHAARIDSLFAFATDSTPGCAVGTYRDGAIVYAKGYGMADLENDVRITPQSAFYMASVSKQFAAAAINLLVVDGKLSLDDDVRKHVPELPDFGTPITIKHLIYHTSGIRDYLDLFFLAGLTDFPITNADFLGMMSRQRALNFPPGDQLAYSNSNYVLLSIVVERVSGKSLRDFSRERMFGPLGMTSTEFRDRHQSIVKRRVTGYRARSTGGGYFISIPYFDVVGDGGLFSTVEDLAKWDANFLSPRIGGAEWIKLQHTRGRMNGGELLPFGAGLVVSAYRGDSIIEASGGYGGYTTYLLRFPSRRVGIAVLCNSPRVSAYQLARGVADIYLGDVLAPKTRPSGLPPGTRSGGSPNAGSFARFAGTFFDDARGAIDEVVSTAGKLSLRGDGRVDELVPAATGTNRFAIPGSSTTVAFSANADTMHLLAPEVPASTYHRVATRSRPLTDYTGSYVSPDIRANWSVAVSDSGLILRPQRLQPLTLKPVFEDAFGGGVVARFVRGPGGEVVAMNVHAGESARNIRFEKQPR